MKVITIYTDGSVHPNPGGVGGWAFIYLDYYGPDQPLISSGFELRTTNNRMELRAAISALESIQTGQFVTIVTDSQYVQRCFARRRWPCTKPNADLGEYMNEVRRGKNVEIQYVPGHSGNKWNEKAHAEANAARLEGLSYRKIEKYYTTRDFMEAASRTWAAAHVAPVLRQPWGPMPEPPVSSGLAF